MTTLDALQQVLAEEHRAVYVVAFAGGRANALKKARSLQRSLESAYEDHLAQRSWLEDRISRLGADPVAAELTYPVPSGTEGAAQIEDVAAAAEQRCVVAYLALVGASAAGSPLRRAAVKAQAAAAVRAAGFGAALEPLPGYIA